jgi:hypothetical protein
MNPSRLWYFAAPVVFVAGVLGARDLISTRLDAVAASMRRFVVPGTVELTLEQPGTYTIYHEASGVIDGKLYVSENVNGLQVRVAAVPGDAPVPVSTPGGSETYSLSGASGVAVLAFDAAAAGRYRLTAGYDGGKTEPKVVLMVARGMLRRMMSAIFAGIAPGFGGFAVALAIIITTAVKRGQARKAAAS